MTSYAPRIIGALLLLCAVPLFFADLNTWFGSIPAELGAFAHVFFFGLLAILLLRAPIHGSDRYPRKALRTLFLVLAASILMELAQPAFGRSAAIRDIWENLVGAGLAVSLSAPTGITRRSLVGLAALLVIAELWYPALITWDWRTSQVNFPVLAEFDSRLEAMRWTSGTRDAGTARKGSYSLRVPLQPGPVAGTALRRNLGDWNGYSHLEVSLQNPDEETLPIIISICDHQAFSRRCEETGRFALELILEQGWTDVRIPLTEIRSAPASLLMDLADLAVIELYTRDLTRPRDLRVDAIRLTSD